MNSRAQGRSKKELSRWVENLVSQLDQLLATQGVADYSGVKDPASHTALKNALGLWQSLAQLLSSRHN